MTIAPTPAQIGILTLCFSATEISTGPMLAS